MKITSVKGIQLRCPCEEIHDALSTSIARQAFLIRIETDKGIWGIGEAFSFGAPLNALQTLLDQQIAPIILEKEAENIEELWQTMYWRTLANGRRSLTMAIISGVDTALWDILGKAAHMSVSHLLGLAFQKIPTYASGGFYAPGKGLDGLRKELSSYRKKGYKDAKIKIGRTSSNPFLDYMDNKNDKVSEEEDWQRIQAAHEIMEDGMLMVDTNATWTADQVIQNAPKLQTYGVKIIEEPLPFEDVDGYRKIADAVPSLVIAGCETQQGLKNFQNLLKENQIDILQPDVGWAGGISEVKKIGAAALAANKKISLHCFGSAVLFAASLQTAAAMSNTIAMESEENPNPLKTDILKTPFQTDPEMNFFVPDGPGLGIEVDWDHIEKYIVK